MTEEAKNRVEEREEKRRIAKENIAAFEQLAKNGVDISEHEAYLDAKGYIKSLDEEALNNSQANYGDDKSLGDLETELNEIKSGLNSNLDEIKKCDMYIRKLNNEIEKVKKEQEAVTLKAAKEVYESALKELYVKLQAVRMHKADIQERVRSYTGTSINKAKNVLKNETIDASTDLGADIAQNEYAIAKKQAAKDAIEIKRQLEDIDKVISFFPNNELTTKKEELEATLEKYKRMFGIEITNIEETKELANNNNEAEEAKKIEAKENSEETKKVEEIPNIENLNKAIENVSDAEKSKHDESIDASTLDEIKRRFEAEDAAGEDIDHGTIYDGEEIEHKPTMIKKITTNIAKGIKNNKVKMAIKALAGIGVATGIIAMIPAAWPITMPIAAYLGYDAYKKGARG